ncbi:hypothetical protein BGX38DRAFT_503762 [Terfezia claveryi]|nr:hypothetical protein BGX38DRAFT_503762 [Terfezia claveryi]
MRCMGFRFDAMHRTAMIMITNPNVSVATDRPWMLILGPQTIKVWPMFQHSQPTLVLNNLRRVPLEPSLNLESFPPTVIYRLRVLSAFLFTLPRSSQTSRADGLPLPPSVPHTPAFFEIERLQRGALQSISKYTYSYPRLTIHSYILLGCLFIVPEYTGFRVLTDTYCAGVQDRREIETVLKLKHRVLRCSIGRSIKPTLLAAFMKLHIYGLYEAEFVLLFNIKAQAQPQYQPSLFHCSPPTC